MHDRNISSVSEKGMITVMDNENLNEEIHPETTDNGNCEEPLYSEAEEAGSFEEESGRQGRKRKFA